MQAVRLHKAQQNKIGCPSNLTIQPLSLTATQRLHFKASGPTDPPTTTTESRGPPRALPRGRAQISQFVRPGIVSGTGMDKSVAAFYLGLPPHISDNRDILEYPKYSELITQTKNYNNLHLNWYSNNFYHVKLNHIQLSYSLPPELKIAWAWTSGKVVKERKESRPAAAEWSPWNTSEIALVIERSPQERQEPRRQIIMWSAWILLPGN